MMIFSFLKEIAINNTLLFWLFTIFENLLRFFVDNFVDNNFISRYERAFFLYVPIVIKFVLK